ncbi:MAG: ABC-2 family transporter protein [Bariatricus sp.]
MTIFTTSIFFYTEGTFSLFNTMELFKEFAKYPISIFGKWGMWILPIGMNSYFPAKLLLADSPKAFHTYLIIGGFISVLLFLLSNKFFIHSTKKYQSTGG